MKIIYVSNCKDCPYSGIEWSITSGQDIYSCLCLENSYDPYGIFLDDPETIPDWCKLEDYIQN